MPVPGLRVGMCKCSVSNISIAPAKCVCLGFYVVLFFENERRVGDNDFY